MVFSLRARENIFALLLIAPCFLFILTFAFYPIAYSFFLSLHRIVICLPGLGQPFIWFGNYR